MIHGELVQLRIEAPTAWLTLNRPDRLNALSEGMRTALAAALDAVELRDEVRAVVITGAGRAFCAGGDLSEFKTEIDRGETAALSAGVAAMGALFSRLEAFPKPVIAAVNGVAVAGGLELVLCCDLVIAAAGSEIGDGHLRYGVLPGGGGSIRLARKLPANRASQLLLTGDLFPAETLAEWGLVNAVVPAGDLAAAAARLARRIAERSPLGLDFGKRLLGIAADLPRDAALEAEHTLFDEYIQSNDFREGLQAFKDKRKPRFTGR